MRWTQIAVVAAARTEIQSRRGGGSAERGQVSPLIGLLERVIVVGGMNCVHLRGTVASGQSGQRLIDEDGVAVFSGVWSFNQG